MPASISLGHGLQAEIEGDEIILKDEVLSDVIVLSRDQFYRLASLVNGEKVPERI